MVETVTLDVAATVKEVNDNLIGWGFTPRDADGNDFQRGDDTSLRFKTGTSRGEVAIQVYGRQTVIKVIRILQAHQIDAALDEMHTLIKDQKERVAVYAEGREEPIAEFEVPE